MIDGKKVVAVIPARGGSKRLPRKNIYPVCGVPMLAWAINACQKSEYIDRVYVSTEDKEIWGIALGHRAGVIVRPEELAEDHVFKQDAIIHATDVLVNPEAGTIVSPNYDTVGIPDIVISVQANSPEINSDDLDRALEKFIKFDRSEIFSVNEDLIMNAAFRIMRREYVYQKSLSTRSGVYVTNYIDVHDIDNVKEVEERLNGTKKRKN